MSATRGAVVLLFLSASIGCGTAEDGSPPPTEANSGLEDTDIEPETTAAGQPDIDVGEDSDAADDVHTSATAPTRPTEPADPTAAGFDIALEPGMWWDYAYFSEGRVASASGATHSAEEGTYRVMLAPVETVGDIAAHPLLVVPVSGDPPLDPPPWDHITIDGSTWLGSQERGEFLTVYDATGGSQAGGGFFDRFASDALIDVEQGIASFGNEFAAHTDSAYIDASVIVFRHSDDKSRCVQLETGTVCGGGESFNEFAKEYFLPEVGPLGRTLFISGSDDGVSYTRSVYTVLIDHGTGGAIPEHTVPADSTAHEFVRYVDDTGTFAIAVPASWSAVQTIPQTWSGGELPKIAAALDSSVGSDSWGAPGTVVYYFSGAITDSPDRADWLRQLASSNAAVCEDLVAVGDGERHHEFQHSGCSSHQARMRYLAYDIDGTSDRLLVTFQWIDLEDFEHYSRILDSVEFL